MSCDGTSDSRDGRTSSSYSTTSVRLADQVQRLAFLLGYTASLREDRPGSFGSLPVYRVLVSEKTETSVRVATDVDRVTYTGKVYCFTVSTGVFVTRRNGKIAIQGNTANVAMFAAETQVFAPMRTIDDEHLNNKLILSRAGLRLKTCKLVSRTPAITSPEMMMKSLTALNVMGAVTPREAQKAGNKMLQMELDQYPEKGGADYEDWMDRPVPITTARSNPDDSIDPETGIAAPAAPGQPPTKGGKTDNMQNQKDATTKAVEKSGNIGQTQPEHGSE